MTHLDITRVELKVLQLISYETSHYKNWPDQCIY